MTGKNSLAAKTVHILINNLNIAILVLMSGFSFVSVYGASVTYTEDDSDFQNPERGFHEGDGNRNGTVYKEYFRLYGGNLDSDDIDDFVDECNDARRNKRKLIPRFRYEGNEPGVEEMLKQIEKLRSAFAENYDVVAYLEAGFIGEYGEWHGSPIDREDAESRRKVLFKLLDVMPKERMVTLRYNYEKRAIFESDEPISPDSAFNQSYKSRTGHINDCFVANEHDAGTYHRLPWEYNALGIEAEKDYLSAENLYVPQSGETCQVSGTSFGTCERALEDLERMRWDGIQSGWYGPVLNKWKNEGCWDEIARRLGYRIVLMDGEFDDEVKDGIMKGTLRLKNVGFGKMYNARKFEIVLRNVQNGDEYVLPMYHDPRFWSPGQERTLNMQLHVPDTVPFGTYSIYLSLQDPAPKLYGIPEYAVRLANKDVWDSDKGYNSLKHNLKVSSHSFIPQSVKKDVSIDNIFSVNNGNPGSRSVEINFQNAKNLNVRIDVYDLSGKMVKNIVNEKYTEGPHKAIWMGKSESGADAPRGIYFVTFRSEGLLSTKRLILKN